MRKDDMYEKRSRFAPSPSGKLHIGGAMSALYTFLMIKGMGGKLLMRIDDTDQGRSSEFHMTRITDSLKWIGIEWNQDEEVRQSDRLPLYRDVAESMIVSGSAYPCFCSKDKLAMDKQNFGRKGKPFVYDGNCRNIPYAEAHRRMKHESYAIRIKNIGIDLEFKDTILGKKKFEGTQFGDFIIMRDDHWPAYNFACAVDDASMNITHVARGQDHIINTPKQLIIYDGMGCVTPKFVHFPLVVDSTTNKKMSKRDGNNISVCDYKSMGINPKAMQRYLFGMGIKKSKLKDYSIESMVNKFDVSQVKKARVTHDHGVLMALDAEVKNTLTP